MTAMMDRTGVARSLEQIAAYLELKGENPFRVRAFTGAAKTVLGFPANSTSNCRWHPRAREGDRTHPPDHRGVVGSGRSELLEQLREDVPAGLVEMLGIPGLGVAKIRLIHDVLGIETIPELEAAAGDGRLAHLPRFGARTAEKVLKGVAFLRAASAWRLSHHAADEAEALRAGCRDCRMYSRCTSPGTSGGATRSSTVGNGAGCRCSAC